MRRRRTSAGELAALLPRALALLVSNVEEFGITAVEAQAAGRPVVAADAGGAHETVIASETGVLVQSGKRSTKLRISVRRTRRRTLRRLKIVGVRTNLALFSGSGSRLASRLRRLGASRSGGEPVQASEYPLCWGYDANTSRSSIRSPSTTTTAGNPRAVQAAAGPAAPRIPDTSDADGRLCGGGCTESGSRSPATAPGSGARRSVGRSRVQTSCSRARTRCNGRRPSPSRGAECR
jgi:hypothetical protein